MVIGAEFSRRLVESQARAKRFVVMGTVQGIVPEIVFAIVFAGWRVLGPKLHWRLGLGRLP
jgi:hypothetical protein